MVGKQGEGELRAILYANLRSGRGRRWLPEVVKQCEAQAISLSATYFDFHPDAIRRNLKNAASDGIETVLVSGGDGSVGSVLAQTSHTAMAVGVLPAGTSNDIARSLGVPMSVDGAVQVVAGGRVTRIDLGEAGGRPFGHAAIMGINTQFAQAAERLRRFLGRVSYPIASCQVYAQRVPFSARLEGDGVIREFKAYEIAFVNAPVYGGPLELEVPKTGLTDSTLTAVVIEDFHLISMIRALPAALSRHSLNLPGVRAFDVHDVQVMTDGPMSVTVDGEVGPYTPLRVRVLPRAQKVYVPESFVRDEHNRAS